MAKIANPQKLQRQQAAAKQALKNSATASPAVARSQVTRKRLIRDSTVPNAGALNVCPVHGRADVRIVDIEGIPHYQCFAATGPAQQCTLVLGRAPARSRTQEMLDPV